MKKTMLGKLLLSGTMLTSVLFGFTSASSAADPVVVSGNPIITSIFTADPSAHVWSDGRIDGIRRTIFSRPVAAI